MEHKTTKDLLRNPAWMWIFGIGVGCLIFAFLIPSDSIGFLRWARPVCIAIAVGFILYSFAHIVKYYA